MSAESGSESIDIQATPEAIFQVMTDIDSFPKWMDEFKEATVIDRDDQGRPSRASFELDAKIKTVRYVLAYSYPEGGLAWESEPGGDVKLIKGSYLMSPAPSRADATTVTYNFEIDPGFPVPSFIRRQAVKMIVSRSIGKRWSIIRAASRNLPRSKWPRMSSTPERVFACCSGSTVAARRKAT